ncbi:MAG: DUF2437 domain-containing protein, partial [Actinobacteria bacterium]|nr:DUF2437 domain-containing protein [Actinomycetota bacterium]
MRIVRFTPSEKLGLGSDPRFGILESDSEIRLIASDPLYAGVFREEKVLPLDSVRLLAPVIPRSKVVCV